MTIDHIGYFMFPGLVWLRIIGRIAFPCFLYTTIQGEKETKNFKAYLVRLLITAVLSMLVTGLSGNFLNILFSLSLFAVSLRDRRLIVPALLLSHFTEYGIYGFLLGWGIKIMVDHHREIGLLFLVLLHATLIASIQFYTIFAVILLLLPKGINLPRVPKVFGYMYYPLHQLILFLIGNFL